MRRRRCTEDRNELPARRLRALRSVQGETVQPRDAGNSLQGKVDRRCARHDGRGGGGILQRDTAASAEAPDALRGGARLYPVGTTGDDDLRRRGAAREAFDRTFQSRDGENILYTGRA